MTRFTPAPFDRTAVLFVVLLLSSIASFASTLPGSLELELEEGTFWEFLWTTESVDFVQGSGTTRTLGSDLFRVELGAPVSIAGLNAFPLIVTGSTTDEEVDFAPRWTHVAADANGSLFGSTDGVALEEIWNAHGSWFGGGFLVEFPDEVLIGIEEHTFEGNFNTLSALAAERDLTAGECTFYPSIGQLVCPDDETYTIRETEYFKPGVGPLGLSQFVQVVFTGGGFTTSFTDSRTVELVGSSLEPADGSTIQPPPWKRVAPLQVGRDNHAAVVLNGKIWVLGGLAGSEPLDSVEIYDPAADRWTFGPPLPEPMWAHTAEVLGGKIYVPSPLGPVFEYDPATEQWSERADAGVFLRAHSTCRLEDPTGEWLGGILAGGSFPSYELRVRLYSQSTNEWFLGFSQPVSYDLRGAAVACLDNDMYLMGGNELFVFSGLQLSGRVLRYDAVAGLWDTSLTGWMNTPRKSHAAVSWFGRPVVLGGWNGSRETRDVEIYDPATDTWDFLPPMRKPRQEFDAVVLRGKIYVIGGDLGPDSISDVEVYDAASLLADGFESGDVSAWSSGGP